MVCLGGEHDKWTRQHLAGCIQKLGPAAESAVPGLIAILGSNDEMALFCFQCFATHWPIG